MPHANPTPEQIRVLTQRGTELWEHTPTNQLVSIYRKKRVLFFSNLWSAVSLVIDDVCDNTIVKGDLPTPDQRAQLYRVQMLGVAKFGIFSALNNLAADHFTDGFLFHAANAAVWDETENQWFHSLDADNDIKTPQDVVDRQLFTMARAAGIIEATLYEEQDAGLKAARQKDTIALIPGYTDVRHKKQEYTRAFDVDPMRVPNEPLDDVDFVADVLHGLAEAGKDDRMKHRAHVFIANRIALKKLPLWRKNYYKLEV